MPTVYLNGDFLPEEDACVSVLDRGFIFGDGVFSSTGWKIFDVFISNMIIFFTPVGILVGLAGSLILYINRIASRPQQSA